jgi:SAM-dependent methyltransferase
MEPTAITSNEEQIRFWNAEGGANWVRAQGQLDAMMRGITAELLTAANPRAGEHVLDVGCGCGDTSLQLMNRVGGGGWVTGLDISEPMLAEAVRRAKLQGGKQMSFVKADAATYDFVPSFDLIVSRFGVMFFADPTAAFANLRKALKPRGRVCFVCWREARENEWARLPVEAARLHVPPLPRPGPEDPGPFSFADPARVRRILAGAGFGEIASRPFDTTVELGQGLEDAVSHLQEFGPLSRMLKEASPQQRSNAVAAVRAALAPFAKRQPFTLNAAVWVVHCMRT